MVDHSPAHTSAHPARSMSGGFTVSVVAVAAASTVLPFSITGTAVVLPQLGDAVHATVGQVQWVQNAFNLTFASLALFWGSMADRLGRKRVLRVGIAVVAAASLVAACSAHALMIDLVRLVQGAGSAAVLASGAAVLSHASGSDPRRRAVAFGVLGTSFGAGLALGPPVAGLLVAGFGWRSPFVAVAVVAATAWFLATGIGESRATTRSRTDIPGAVCFTAGLSCVSYLFVAASTDGWTSTATLASAAGALVLLTAFAFVERRRRTDAMFDVRLLTRPRFLAVICQPFALTLGLVVLITYIPPFLQGLSGRSALTSGLQLLPLTLPVLLLPTAGAWLAARTSLRVVLTTAALLTSAGTAALITVTPASTTLALGWPLLLSGTGVGLAFGVLDNAAVSSVPADRAGAASGIFNTMRLVGESTAIAGAAALLTTITSAGLGNLPGATNLAGTAVQGHLPVSARALVAPALTHALHVTGLTLAALSAAGALLTYLALRPGPERTG